MTWLRRLWNAVRPRRLERDIERELQFHVAERADELRAEGVSADEAVRHARRQLGNFVVQRERLRDVNVSAWVEGLLRNVRLAIRTLLRTPAFSIGVIVTLALGIGANGAVFSAIDAILLRPLPFHDADRLVRLFEIRTASGNTNIAPVRLDDWNRLNSTFEAISGYFTDDVVDTTSDLPQRIRRAVVTPSFFDVLRIAPAHGRRFTQGEHQFGAAPVILLSERLWRSRGADPAAPGSTIRSAGLVVTIVGVMPMFPFADPDVDVWAPMPVNAPFAQSRAGGWFTAIGRLEPGVTLEQAREDLKSVQARLAAQYPDTDRDVAVRIEPLKETVVGGARRSLWLVFGAVSVLLLIACTNIAALLLSRATEREREVSVRFALGASRIAVCGQLLAEAGVLALAGAALGLPVAVAAARAIESLAPDLPRLDEVTIGARSLLYTTAAAGIVALLCGVAPAVRGARRGKNLSRSGSAHIVPRHSLQWLLVGVQVALSVTLAAAAALLLRTSDALSRVEPGFDASRVLTFHVTGRFGEDGGEYGRVVQRINGSLDALVDVPGVSAAATTTMLPGVPAGQQQEFRLLEGRADSEPRLVAESRVVSPSYFATMGIPLLSGELCARPGDAQGVTEVMVNRSFADRYFPGRSVVGLHLAANTPDRITGIVGDARELGPDREPIPTVYSCFSAPNPVPWFLVRTTGDPLAAAAAIRVRLKQLEPFRPVYDIAPLERRIADAYAQGYMRTVLLTLFAVTALALVSAGVYGTLSYAVSLRRREVALHLALGALRHAVVQRLIGDALRVVGVGCACGLLLALLFARSLSAMLYGVSPSDPATLTGVIALVVVIAATAALIPAARAAFVQPMRVLRED
ncbi:MAG TPA: ADOP family duplicated permease [Vicinamibacterales bacterium]|nr:ADOP family duplicated permease [Vicinamibacterales bacterium]